MNQQHLSKLSKRLKRFFGEKDLNELGKTLRFSRRDRRVTPFRLVMALMEIFSCGTVGSIADIQRGFNALFGLGVRYKPFHKQLVKPQFAEFMRVLFSQLMSQLACQSLSFDNGSPFARFTRIVLQDGTSFAVHPGLSEAYPGRFHAVSPAAVELHVTLDLLSECPAQVVLTADTESEPQFLPEAKALTGCLVMGDRGYFKKAYFAELMDHGVAFIVRGKGNMNPTVRRVITASGHDIKAWRDKPLGTLKGKFRKQGPMDMDIDWHEGGKRMDCRLIVTWNKQTKAFQYLVTNLSRKAFTVTDIMDAYHLRWQIELVFKEWKSHANLKALNTAKESILQGVIWAALCAATLKRFFAHMTQKLTGAAISTRKVAMCLRHFLTDILRALISHPRKLKQQLQAAIRFLADNARRDNLKRDQQYGRAKLGLYHDFSFA